MGTNGVSYQAVRVYVRNGNRVEEHVAAVQTNTTFKINNMSVKVDNNGQVFTRKPSTIGGAIVVSDGGWVKSNNNLNLDNNEFQYFKYYAGMTDEGTGFNMTLSQADVNRARKR